MRLVRTEHFRRQWQKLSPAIRQRAKKAIRLLASNSRHPSLRVKIVDEERRVWQARVNGGYRFYFKIRGNAYFLLSIIAHPK